jgi:anti-sigma factor RsiW
MSCSPFDLRDYFLQELPQNQEQQVEAHVKTCQGCREELDRLRATGTALLALREEEIPQRIAFVSDKIFEPSPLRRWWGGFWNSAARLGFASAAILAVALVMRTSPRTPVTAQAPPPARVQTVSDADIQARIDAAVTKAVAQSEARQEARNKAVLAELETTRQRLILAAGEYEMSMKRAALQRASNYVLPPERDLR